MNDGGNGGGAIIAIIVVIIMFFTMCSDGGSSGSHRDEPWKDLGVTEREYNQVYNYYKYGEWTG